MMLNSTCTSIKFILAFFVIALVVSCDSSKMRETSINKFEGVWELEGRKMFKGIQVQIKSDSNSDNLIGTVIRLNDNKYIQMLVDSGDKWVSGISRKSNFEFRLTEKKIGSQLFSLYGQSTSSKFNVQFIDENTFGLGSKNSNPMKSSIIYKRVK